MARTFTRKEFYDLVWSKPMTHLAKEFILSDVALHKICRKHNIPNPPLGWWAKKAAGKKVTQTPLPRSKDTSLDRITIVPGEIRTEPDHIVAARESSRILVSTLMVADPPPVHPIVARTMERLRVAKPSETNGLVSIKQANCIGIEVAPSSADRLSLALNRIAAVAEPMGIRLVKADKSAAFEHDGEVIGFTVTEGVKREKHILTEKEQAEQLAWRKASEKKWGEDNRRLFSNLYRHRLPEWDYHPTGQLTFEFDRSSAGSAPRRSFRDAKVQRLENMVAEIAVGIVAASAAVKEDRIRRQNWERREEEERQCRERAQRAKHVDDRRGAALDELLEEMSALVRLRRLVEALRAEHGAELTGRVATFVAFANARLAAREEALTVNALEQRLMKSKLFGDDDDFDFWPRRH